jgi:hypothetical protein
MLSGVDGPPKRIGLDVVELDEGKLGAPLSVGRHEAALPSVPPPGHALRLIRRVPRPALIRPGTDRTRLLRRADLLSLDLLEEQRDGAIEDGARISVRDFAAKQRLKARSLSCVSLPTVNWTRYRSGEVGSRIGRVDGGGVRIDGAGSEVAIGLVAIGAQGAGAAAVGSFRTVDGTSGRGARRAISSRTSCRLRPDASASTTSWFSGVRCGRSMRTVASDNAPEANRSRITGNRRQARATSMRLQAASSESRNTCAQSVKSEP